MLGIERRQAIIERLKRDERVYVRDLAREFTVTEETIRRDLERLEEEDIISRNYGGAVLKAPVADALSFARRSFLNSDEKECIAARAAALIEGKSRVMIGTGTTALALLAHLKKRRGLAIITNSARAIALATDGAASIYSTGGKLKAQTLALVGPSALATVRNFAADIAAIGCKGIDLDGGVLETDEEEAAVKREMLKRAKKRLLLADSTKFGRPALAVIAPWECFDAVITDKQPSHAWREFFKKRKIELIVAQ